MNDTLLRLVYDRLDRDAAVDEPWAELVMAACEGEAAVEAVLDEQHAAAPLPAPAATASDPPGVFLRSISVAGFRGVGHKTTLEVSSGPGLTLVVGRNGSGKSSFAEALELLLTGENKRWADRSKAWSDGWRNLHVGDPCAIEASLSVEGAGKTTVRRGWAPDADLDDGESVVQPHGKPRTTLEGIGWAEVLGTYRPFLSYNELGSMLDEGPSKLYDALARVLGLDDLVETDAALATARKSRQGAVKQVKDLAGALQTRIRTLADGSPDDRLARALALLGSRRPDLDGLEELTDGSGEGEPDDALRLLKQCVGHRRARPGPGRDRGEQSRRRRGRESRIRGHRSGAGRRARRPAADGALVSREAHGDRLSRLWPRGGTGRVVARGDGHGGRPASSACTAVPGGRAGAGACPERRSEPAGPSAAVPHEAQPRLGSTGQPWHGPGMPGSTGLRSTPRRRWLITYETGSRPWRLRRANWSTRLARSWRDARTSGGR